MEKQDHKEVGLRRLIALLAVLMAFIVVYDVWCLASGNAKDGLYVLPFALGAFIVVLTKIVRYFERFDPDGSARLEFKLPKDPRRHPDDHSKERRGAPDGTSD